MHTLRWIMLASAILGTVLLVGTGRLVVGTLEAPNADDGAIEEADVFWAGVETSSGRDSWSTVREDWKNAFGEDPEWAQRFDHGGGWYLGAALTAIVATLFTVAGVWTRKHLARTAAVFAGVATVLLLIGIGVFSTGFGLYEEAAADLGIPDVEAGWGAGLAFPIVAALALGTVAVLGWWPVHRADPTTTQDTGTDNHQETGADTGAPSEAPAARTGSIACPRCRSAVTVPSATRPLRLSCGACGASGTLNR